MKWLIGFLCVVLILLQVRLWTGDGGVMEVMNLKQEVDVQQERVKTLAERNQMLEAEVQDLKNRLSALEERARTDLGMVRKGETFYQDAS